MKNYIKKITVTAVTLACSLFALSGLAAPTASLDHSAYLLIHNNINSFSNAEHNGYWGNPIPANQEGKITWSFIKDYCLAPLFGDSNACVLHVFVIKPHQAIDVGTVSLDLTSNKVASVSIINPHYRIIKNNNSELTLQKA